MTNYMSTEEIAATLTAEEIEALATDMMVDEYWEREADVIMAQYDYPEDF